MSDASRPARDSKPWAAFRALLGMGQMSGAAIGLGFLLTTGVSDLTLMVVIGTCSLMLLSLLLFRNRN